MVTSANNNLSFHPVDNESLFIMDIIFIVGYSRSGTKMMNRILSELDVVKYTPEIHFFEQMYDFIQPEKKRNAILSPKSALTIVNRLMNNVARVGLKVHDGRLVSDIQEALLNKVKIMDSPTSINIYKAVVAELSSPIAVDPTPRNSYYIPEITKEIPSAVFIYMVRDPRDCILSQKNKWKNHLFNKKRYFETLRLLVNYNPYLMAKFWKNSLSTLNSINALPIEQKVHLVRYEELTQNPEKIIPDILKFLSVPDKYHDISFIRKGNNEKWKKHLSKYQVVLIQNIVKDELNELGYEFVDYRLYVNFISFLLRGYYLTKIPLAFFMNINRMNNPLEMVRKRILGK